MAYAYREMGKIAYGEYMAAICRCGKPTRCTKCIDCCNKTSQVFEQIANGVSPFDSSDIKWYEIMAKYAISCSKIYDTISKSTFIMECQCCQNTDCRGTFCYECYLTESKFFDLLKTNDPSLKELSI